MQQMFVWLAEKGGYKSTFLYFYIYDDYINNIHGLSSIDDIIVPIEDYNNNNRIEVTDFLNMTEKNMEETKMGKHFSVCLMNPPYSKGNPELKFLEKTIKICDKVVSIQPVRWLEDTLVKYRKSSKLKTYEDSICKHIKELEKFTTKDNIRMFKDNAEFQMNLGIYVCDKNGGYQYQFDNKILDKIINQLNTTWDDVIKYKTPDDGVVITKMIGGKGGLTERTLGMFDWNENNHFIYKNGKRLDNGLTFYENRLKTAWGNVKPKKETTFIEFNTEEESNNFIDFTKLYLIRYLIRIETVDINLRPKYLPFMDDYTHKWTNEMLYKEFNITKEEQKEIEKLINYYIEYNKEVDKAWKG